MSDSFESQRWVRTGISGAMIKAASQGSAEALEQFKQLIDTLFPGRGKFEYQGFLTKKLVQVGVELADYRYTLGLGKYQELEPTRTHYSRGIALKAETLSMEDWLDQLTEALELKAGSDQAAYRALQNWLGRVP